MNINGQPYVVPFPKGVPYYSLCHGENICPPDTPFRPFLNSDWDLFFVCKGRCVWDLKEGRQLIAQKNEFVLIPPLVPFQRRPPNAELIFWFCHFNFRPSGSQQSVDMDRNSLWDDHEILLPLTFTRSEAPNVWRAFHELIHLKNKMPNLPWQYDSALIKMIAELASFASARTKRGAPGNPFNLPREQDSRISEICQQIDANPEFSWKIADFAKISGLSYGHLQHLFHQAHGKSMKRYILDARFKNEVEFLKHSNQRKQLSIKEISQACGFPSQNLFARQFKKYHRVSPMFFRKNLL